MGTRQGSVNSTRLSLDIADLPLTPFGMSPRGSARRGQIYQSPRNNKLSLKTLKPLQEEKQVSNFHKENKENKNDSSSSRILTQRSSRTPVRNGHLGLKTLYEHHSSDTTDVYESQHLEGSRATVDSRVISDATSSDKEQNQRNSTEESSRRGSVFTDIDDGSFIEFFHGKENGRPVAKLKENQGRCTPQLYYTCESQNETQYSTSTKKDTALVGFRKYVETIRRQKGLQDMKGSKMEMFGKPGKTKNFNSNETIITGSADIMQKYQSKVNEKRAINSTMIEQAPCQVQVPFPQVFSNISALTVQKEVSSSESTNPSPVMSPKYLHRRCRKDDNQVIVISESSDDESSEIVRALNEKKGDAGVIKPKSWEGDNFFTSQQQAVGLSQGAADSLISEDISVVSSSALTRHQLQKPKSTETDPISLASSGLEEKNVHSTVKESTEEARLVCQYECNANDDLNYDADCEECNPDSAETSERPIVVMPDNAKSPAVAKWIITSPFKDSSFGSSFLQRNDVPDVREMPSQPKGSGIGEPYRTSKKSSEHEIWRNLKKSKEMSYSVSKAKNSPRSLDSSSSSCSDSSSSENCLKVKKYRNLRTVIESSSEESNSVDKERMFNSHKRQDSDVKISLNSAKHDYTGESDEKSHEVPLRLRVSNSVDKERMFNSHKRQDSDVKISLSSPKHDYTGESDEKSHEVPLRLRVSNSVNKDRMFDSHKRQDSNVKISLSSPKHDYIGESDEESHEVPLRLRVSEDLKRARKKATVPDNIDRASERSSEESLHLRLSEELSKSNKISEKTVCTIGRDATSPVTLRKSLTSGSDRDISYKQKSRCIGKIRSSESDSCNDINDKDEIVNSLSPSDIPLPDIEVHPDNRARTLGQQTTSSSLSKPKENSHVSDNVSNDALDLRRIQEELDKLYSSEWRRNESAVLKSVTSEKSSVIGKQNVKVTINSKISDTEQPVRGIKKKTQRRLSFETDDEEDVENSFFVVSETSDEDEDEHETKDDVPNLPTRKGKTQVDASYCPPSETGQDSDDDSFEIYLKQVKRQIKQDKKLQTDSVSKVLPSRTHVKKRITPGYELDSKACGSISEDLRLRKDFEDPKKSIRSITGSSSWRDSPALTISSDSDSDEVFTLTEVKKKPLQPSLPFVTPKLKAKGKVFPKTEGHCSQVSRRYELSAGISGTASFSFLASLSANIHISRCHPEALIYIKNFKKLKEHLLEKLYKYYNTHVFENKLPSEMNIKWNARMTKTAGFCYYQMDRSKPNGRGARIELSTKVIDAPERMRDTLIHELCHAAAWIISGYKVGHGPLWKAWAAKAIRAFPELPAISRCHSYEISCKYTYRCTHCSYSIGRHSKSLDIEKKVCGHCFGKFELVVNSRQGRKGEIGNGRGSEKSNPNTLTPLPPPKTPRTPGVFAMFVKENYGSVKKSGQNLKHVDVMKLLSVEFGKLKATSN